MVLLCWQALVWVRKIVWLLRLTWLFMLPVVRYLVRPKWHTPATMPAFVHCTLRLQQDSTRLPDWLCDRESLLIFRRMLNALSRISVAVVG
jgi:hypothetical protein